jgi:hypothetical protein
MRITVFAAVVCSALFAPAWVFALCAVAYAFWRPAYELIVLGALVDLGFSPLSSVFDFKYTLLLGALVLMVEFLKPYVSYYEART